MMGVGPGTRDEDANMMAFEGILVAIILLAAIGATMALQRPTFEGEQIRTHLETAAVDALTVLGGLKNAEGPFLEAYVTQALHCRHDLEPSTTDCDGARPANLSVRLENYLPEGASFAVFIDNGVADRPVYATGVGVGERVSASRIIAPDWRLTYVTTGLSCYEEGMDVDVALIPITRSASATASYVNASFTAGTVAEAANDGNGIWRATLASPGVPQDFITSAVNASHGPHPGGVAYETCGLGAHGALLRAGLDGSSFQIASPTVALGDSQEFSYDLRMIAQAMDDASVAVEVERVRLFVYTAIAPRPDRPDSFIVSQTVEITPGWHGTHAWTPEMSSYYGLHPMVLVADLDVDGVKVAVRLVDTSTVAMRSGVVPIDPPYRLVIEAWFPDWR